MKKTRALCLRAAIIVAALVCCAPSLRAQQSRDPRVGYAFPAGGQRGTACEVTVGGRLLEGTKAALVSGSGVSATVIGFTKPLPQKRFNELREYLQEARKKLLESKDKKPPIQRLDGPERVASILTEAGATEDEIRAFFVMRKERNDPKRQQNLQLAETVRLKVEIAPDAASGPHELRLLTPAGVSNPLVFCVGDLPEKSEPEEAGMPANPPPTTKLPAVLNGQILPGQSDHFAFEARRGTRIVIAVHARDLIPFLADAVPGWFQPIVAVYDSKHNEVAYADDYRFGPDPVLCYDVRESGTFVLEIRDALFRGREDFVYRIEMGTIPFVTGIFPLGARAGEPVTVEAAGWNLSRARVSLAPRTAEGIQPIPELTNRFALGDVAFATGTLPEVLEREPNNDSEKAQKVAVPVIINGRIGSPGDLDVFSFACRAGDQVVAEVTARRLDSPLDSWLKITDAAGRQIAFNDDNEDKGSGLLTHHADSRLSFTAPSDGLYFAHLGDAQKKGGSEFAYRLQISAPRPDFALRVVPSGINARAGALVPVTIYALRKDGFAGEIALTLKNAPEGFELEGARIPAGTDKVKATLACPRIPPEKPITFAVEGTAKIGGVELTRRAVPADDMLQAFIYHHLVPAKELLVSVSGQKGGRAAMHVVGNEPMQLPAGGSGQILLSSQSRTPFPTAETKAQLVDPPDGVSVDEISAAAGGTVVTFRADPKVKPGLKGNLIVEVFAEKTATAKDGKPAKNRWSVGLLPAVPFEVTDR